MKELENVNYRSSIDKFVAKRNKKINFKWQFYFIRLTLCDI